MAVRPDNDPSEGGQLATFAHEIGDCPGFHLFGEDSEGKLMARDKTDRLISRRGFIASAPIAAAACTMLAADEKQPAKSKWEAAVDPDLLKHIHPLVRYKRVELPEEKNAYPVWEEARKRFKPFHEFLDELVPRETQEGQDRWDRLEKGYYDTLEIGHAFPAGEVNQVLRDWLRANQQAMKLIDLGLARGQMRYPEETLLDYFDEVVGGLDRTMVLRSFVWLKAVRAKLLRSEKKYEAAVDELIGSARLGHILTESHGCSVQFMIGCGLMNIAYDGIRDLAQDKHISSTLIQRLRVSLKTYRPSATQYAESQRVEFHYFTLPEIARLPDKGTLQELVDVLILRNVLFVWDDAEERLTADKEVVQLRKGLMRLLDGHPAPLDKAETVRIWSREVAALIKDIETPYWKRNRDIGKRVAEEIKAWPSQLSLDANLGLGIGDPQRSKPLSGEALRRARAALSKVHNPVGKHLAEITVGSDIWQRILPLAQTRMAATDVVLALRLYFDEHGEFPESLSGLVDDKLLDQVPIDPFAGKPMSYSRVKGILWSYGVDEKDDGGDWDFDAEWPAGEDIVWKLPKPR